MDLLSISITLFLIMDPVGNIPVFLSVLETVEPARRRKILIRELFFAYLIILIFIFFGRYILGLLGLSQESVSIAGSIILFLIALRMVFPAKGSELLNDVDGEPLIVPLAIPLIAGPSTLAVLILFSTGEPGRLLTLLGAASISWALAFVILLSATALLKLIGKRGLTAMRRLMGMILIALSIQLFLDSLTAYLK